MSKRILILYSGDQPPLLVTQLIGAITRHDATAVLGELRAGLYDQVLDAVALADTVMRWPQDFSP